MSTIQYKTAAAVVATRPSPAIWADCPLVAFEKDPAKGFHVFEDFLELNCGITAVAGSRWYIYYDTNGTINLVDGQTGILRIMTDEDDNDSASMTTGNNETGCIYPADASSKKWWFEARIASVSITSGDVSIFVGLAEEGQAANTKPMADDGTHAVGDIDHVGFHVAGDDGDGVNFVWNLSGQTAQVTADVHTLVASAYVRLGMKYEPGDNKVHCHSDQGIVEWCFSIFTGKIKRLKNFLKNECRQT